jgi:hypothetical protein
MAKTLSEASEDYVKLVEEVVAETGLDRMGVDFQVYNLLKTKNEVVRVQKANEIAEILTNREDLVIVSIFEKAFDKVDAKTQRLWVEAALAKVSYDTEKDKLVIGGEPTLTIPLGMYHKYDKLAVDMAELEQLTLQQIRDEEEEEKERRKSEKKQKKH